MQRATERVCSLAERARAGNTKRVRVFLVIAAVLAGLLMWTTWLSLRPGLYILLAGYVATALWLLNRNAQLAREVRLLRSEAAQSADLLAWFGGEERFLRWSSIAEAAVRAIGFLALGYGFWLTTRSGSISLLLGLVYPAFTVFGARSGAQQAKRKLAIEKEAMIKSLADGANPPSTVQGNQEDER